LREGKRDKLVPAILWRAPKCEESPRSNDRTRAERPTPRTLKLDASGAALEELLERRVDVLTLEDAGANPVLLAEAIAEGRTIVDREERWSQLRSEAKAMDRRSRRHLRERRRGALAGIDRLPTEA
jgi:hypothetical protein